MILGFISLLLTNLIMLAAPKMLQRAVDALRQTATQRELLRRGQIYYKLYQLQYKGQEPLDSASPGVSVPDAEGAG